MTDTVSRRLHTPVATPTSDTQQTSSVARKPPGFLDKLKKYGVVGMITVGIIMPALVAFQLMTAPKSPADFNMPSPPAITMPIQQPDGFDRTPPVIVVQPGVQHPGVQQPGVPQPGVPQPGVQQPGVQQPGVSPPGVQQPGVQQPRVEQPTAQQTVQTLARESVLDGSLSGAEAKALVVLAQQTAEAADWMTLGHLYGHHASTAEARAVLDVAFVRAGVPVGAGQQQIEARVKQLVNDGALGSPMRGRLHTDNMLQTTVDGMRVFTSAGARPQVFVEVPGQGAFGPFALHARVSS